MPRLCTGCGVTTDNDGNLIANTGDTEWPHDCAYTNGTRIYCGDDGVLRGPAEKFTRFWVVRTPEQGTSTKLTDIASVGDEFVQVPGVTASLTITNPSPCLPMTLVVKHGIMHAIVRLLGDGDKNVQIESKLSFSGGLVVPEYFGGHQHWEHDGDLGPNGLFFDSQNSLSDVKVVTLPPGASTTATIRGVVSLYKDDQSLSRLGNLVVSAEILGYN